MESIGDFFSMLSSPDGINKLIMWGGYIILMVIVFAETGLLVGFFLPGDSLLVTAGVMAAHGQLDIALLNLLLIPAAIIGDATGYTIGFRGGKRLLERPDSRFFKRHHIEKTQAFYQKHGGKTIVLARFIPLIRTFAPVVAGIARMPYRRFAAYNILGGAFWIGATTLSGFYLGRQFPNITSKLHYVIAIVVVLSLLPVVVEFIRSRIGKRKAAANG
ncbi:MAG: VTT domain-containing protein [Bacteroidetes bacterium]|nr:VTT domain-containing protein [Bacteroidota bacterium]